MSFDINKHIRTAGKPIQEDSASSKKAWNSRDRGSGQDDSPVDAGKMGQRKNDPKTGKSLPNDGQSYRPQFDDKGIDAKGYDEYGGFERSNTGDPIQDFANDFLQDVGDNIDDPSSLGQLVADAPSIAQSAGINGEAMMTLASTWDNMAKQEADPAMAYELERASGLAFLIGDTLTQYDDAQRDPNEDPDNDPENGFDPTFGMTETVNEALDGIIRRNR